VGVEDGALQVQDGVVEAIVGKHGLLGQCVVAGNAVATAGEPVAGGYPGLGYPTSSTVRENGAVNTLEKWTQAVVAELGLANAADRDLVLDLARDVAHDVARPAAPLTTYLAGVAVGAGQDASDVAARITRLAEEWTSQQ